MKDTEKIAAADAEKVKAAKAKELAEKQKDVNLLEKEIVFFCNLGEFCISFTKDIEALTKGGIMRIVQKGREIQFKNHKFKTNLADEVSFVRSRNEFGVTIFEEGKSKYIPAAAKPGAPVNEAKAKEALEKENMDLRVKGDNDDKEKEALKKEIAALKEKKGK